MQTSTESQFMALSSSPLFYKKNIRYKKLKNHEKVKLDQIFLSKVRFQIDKKNFFSAIMSFIPLII